MMREMLFYVAAFFVASLITVLVGAFIILFGRRHQGGPNGD